MLKFLKKIIPFLGTSFFLFTNKDFLKLINIPKEICLSKENKEVSNLNIEKNKIPPKLNSFFELKNFINDLNKIKVYLLVTNPTQDKLNKKILLLLQPEGRYQAEQASVNSKYIATLTKITRSSRRIKVRRKYFLLPRFIKLQKYSIYGITRPHKFGYNSVSRRLRNAKSYYINNLGGYKSICPVFFDKTSAESFLVEALKKNQKLYDGLSTKCLEKSKENFEGIRNTKIITLGLGDFIDYYSSELNKELLKKVEFLFFPSLGQKRANKRYLKNKNFKFYYNKYCLLKYK